MKLAMRTNVPGPYKRMGQIFSIFLGAGFVFCWGLLGVVSITNGRNLPVDFVVVTFLMLPVVPVALMLLVPPMFLGGYPLWVVSFFGESFLSGFVNSLMAGDPLDRKKLTQEQGVFARLDRRIAFVVLIIFCTVAGILLGIAH